jgi:transposase
MIGLPANTRIWIVAGVTDLRRGFTGLSALVQMKLEAWKVFQQRREAALKAAGRQQVAEASATSGYWLAELAVTFTNP